MTTHAERLEELPVGSRRLWVGVLAAPAAWVAAELSGYYLASQSCEPGLAGLPLEGTATPRLTHALLMLAFLVVAAIGLGVSAANWRAVSPARARRTDRDASGEPGPPELGRARFMALSGVLVSVLFGGGIVLFGISAFMVNACSQAR